MIGNDDFKMRSAHGEKEAEYLDSMTKIGHRLEYHRNLELSIEEI
jgi:hypothetical protein